jgi:rhodanese-related sulfurtransferase
MAEGAGVHDPVPVPVTFGRPNADGAPADADQRRGGVRRGRLLAWFTIAWNSVEGVVGIASGVAAGSIALVGFGVDSYVEVLSGAVVLWRLSKERHGEELSEAAEHRALRIIAGTFFALAGGVALELREVNRHGPRVYGERPTLIPLDVSIIAGLVARGTVVVDVRGVEAFAAGHIGGSLSIPLRPQFASWLGWLVRRDQEVVFVLDAGQDRAELVRQCLAIGYERLAGELAGGIDAWRSKGNSVATVSLVLPDRAIGTVVDVRQRNEFSSGHVPGAISMELGDTAEQISTLPAGPLTVMCGHGERAMSAASILAAGGRTDVSVLLGGPAEVVAARHQHLAV